jgi:hypothetical protein
MRTHPRQIGPLGTISRTIGGVVALTVPLALWGAAWWDWATGLVALPLFSAVAGATVGAIDTRWRFRGSSPCEQMRTVAALLVIVIVLASATAFTFVTPVDATAIWIFVGTSMLLAAANGDAGCELRAFPNLITRRQDAIGCLLFAPVDATEGYGRGRRARHGDSAA